MSYQSALEAAGAEVIQFEYFGSYQGDWLALVRVDGALGVVEGWYGSCSYCDAFESEFGYSESGEDYQERLADFGRGYLPANTLDEMLAKCKYNVTECHWGDYGEMLDQVVKWKQEYEGDEDETND